MSFAQEPASRGSRLSPCLAETVSTQAVFSVSFSRFVMDNRFFEHPILNSPYEYPAHHWELDADGQPT